MRKSAIAWLGRFSPQPNTVTFSEQARACVGALLGLVLTGMVSAAYLSQATPGAAFFLIAPMGASAVLLFCVPASPLAQPWSIIGGNLVSAFIGVSCAKLLGDPMLAASLAGCLAIAAMFALRCLHPPSGAVALTAVLGGPIVHAAGYQFVLVPVGLNSLLLVLVALLFNNATGRRYPHSQQVHHPSIHDTKDEMPTERLGLKPDDLDAVLHDYNQVLDVSRDDLESLFLQAERHAYSRRFGTVRCADIMSRDVVTVSSNSKLDAAWHLMRHHRVHALPVLDDAHRVIGMLDQNDFFEHVDIGRNESVLQAIGRLLRRARPLYAGRSDTVGSIMTQEVKTVRDTAPIVELVPLMTNAGLHHLPVIDENGRFAGIVTLSDLVAGLYENRLTVPDSRADPAAA